MDAKLSARPAAGQRQESEARPLYLAATLLIALILYLPLLGRLGYFSHEDATPYFRILEYVDEIRAGHWLPQTFPRLFRGAGYAFPRFYPPLANGVAVAITMATGDVVAGVHLAFLLSVLCSAVAMYRLVMAWSGNRAAAVIGSLAYIGVPYRFGDVFIRGALAEGWAFVWYPLILLGLWRVRQEGRAPGYLPFVMAALLITHPPMALYFGVVILLLVPVWRPAGRSGGVALGAAGLAAVGLSAWFWLPQQYYLPTVWASVPSAVWSDAAFVHANRVPLETVLTGLPKRNGLNLSVGWLALAAHVLALRSWLRPSLDPVPRALERLAHLTLLAWWPLALFLVRPGVFLSVLPGQFGYIQFPWRVLGPMTFLVALSLACSFAATRAVWIRVACVALVALVIARAGVSPSVIPRWTAPYLEQQMAQGRQFGLTGRSEYLPRTVPGPGDDYAGALQALLASVSSAPRASPGIRIDSIGRRGSATDLVVNATGPGTVVLPLIYYDFYAASFETGTRLATRDSLGLLAIGVPAGRHHIAVRERLTRVTWVGLAISLVTLLILGGRTWLQSHGGVGADSSAALASSS